MHLYIFALLFFILHSACGQSENIALKQVKSVPVNVPEPSGLALSADKKSLWTVSDHSGKIYQLDLAGKLLKTLPPPFPGADLEGVFADADGKTLWLVAERKREVLRVTTDGKLLDRHPLKIQGKKNSGLEGITWHLEKRIFYVTNEKSPALLLKLTDNFQIEKKFTITEAADCAGITYDPIRQKFWLLSDESRCLMLWSEEKGVEKIFPLDIEKAEGVAVHGNQLFVISDRTEQLYLFEISG